MAELIKVTSEMSILWFKDFSSLKGRNFVEEDFKNTMNNMVRYSLRNSVDINGLLNRLSLTNFHTNLVARVFGDIRRFIPKLEKVLMPSLLFSFIDTSLAASGLALSSPEINIVKMIHLAMFKKWGAVIDTSLPASVEKFDHMFPTVDNLVADMYRVMLTKRATEYTLPDLPKEKISAPLVAQMMLDTYVEIQNQLVTLNNVRDHINVVLHVLNGYIKNELEFPHLQNDMQFRSLTSNFTLLRMASSHNAPLAPSKYDGWFISAAIKEFIEYLRTDYSDIGLYKLSDIANICTVNRMINEKSKLVKAVLVTPNLGPIKWTHWFHRTIAYGDQLSKLVTYKDPTSIIAGCFNAMNPTFLQEQLIATMIDIANHDFRSDMSFDFTSLIDPRFEKELHILIALSKSEYFRWKANDKNLSIEYYYEVDDAVVTVGNATIVTMDTIRVARSTAPSIVMAYSKKQLSSTTAFPIVNQTLEFAAKDALLFTDEIVGHSKPIDRTVTVGDKYFSEGGESVITSDLTFSSFLFSGESLTFISVSYSDYLTKYLDLLISTLISAITVSSNISYVRVRLLNNFWISMKRNAITNEFEWLASSFRRHLDISMTPTRIQDTSRNYVKSLVALFRMAYVVGTNVETIKFTQFINELFESQIDVIGLITDSEIKRLST